MKYKLLKLLNRIGLYTKKQIDNSYENGRQSEMHKCYIIDTNNIILQSHPSKWLEKMIEETDEEAKRFKYRGYGF